jgi:hypothetical protein
MIEIDSTPGSGIVTVRYRGAITNRELATLAAMVTSFESHGGMLIFLDWLGIDRWEFSPHEARGVAAWRRAARKIERVAIVHDRRRDRQAAWLAAILRKEGVSVRSWRPQNAGLAATWLRMSAATRHP